MTTDLSAENIEELTKAFFSDISARDWELAIERLDPDARAVQNISGNEVNARELLKSMRGLVESLAHFSYENPRRIVGKESVVEQHDVRMVRHDGVEVVIDICIVLRFSSEVLITRIDEYLDSGALQALRN